MHVVGFKIESVVLNPTSFLPKIWALKVPLNSNEPRMTMLESIDGVTINIPETLRCE